MLPHLDSPVLFRKKNYKTVFHLPFCGPFIHVYALFCPSEKLIYCVWADNFPDIFIIVESVEDRFNVIEKSSNVPIKCMP